MGLHLDNKQNSNVSLILEGKALWVITGFFFFPTLLKSLCRIKRMNRQLHLSL